MIEYTAPQGSDDWKNDRAGKITASRCKDARDFLKSGKPSAKQSAYAAQVAVERIAHRPIDQSFENWQMREGRTQEPFARNAYEAATGNIVDEVGALGTDDGMFLYSPDGTVGKDGLIEIKSLFSADRIVQIIADKDYSDFTDQCMFGLWLTGRQWIDLVLWCPALESIGVQMTVIRIERDDDAIAEMEADLMRFAVLVRENESKLRRLASANADVMQQAA